MVHEQRSLGRSLLLLLQVGGLDLLGQPSVGGIDVLEGLLGLLAGGGKQRLGADLASVDGLGDLGRE